MFKKLKSLLADDGFYMASLLLLVALCSFGLGRLSVAVPSGTDVAPVGSTLQNEHGLIPIVSTSTPVAASQTTDRVASVTDQSLSYVASKSGTKYHKVTCPGAKQIKSENKLFFATPNDAKAAGYTPAANCPGLE